MGFIRIDDVGASTKEFNLYGKNTLKIKNRIISFPPIISNFLFMKRLPIFSGWAKYKELEYNDWIRIIEVLKEKKSRLNVAITACWVNKNSELKRFDEKFPEQVEIIKYGIKEGLIYLINHGLTHCIPGKHLPLRFSSVQKYHREFTKFLPLEKQFMHLKESQRILKEIFGQEPLIFTPPGNMYNENTLISMQKLGLKTIQCERNISHQPSDIMLTKYGIKHICNKNIFVIHDRDIVKGNSNYFENIMSNSYLKNADSLKNLIT